MNFSIFFKRNKPIVNILVFIILFLIWGFLPRKFAIDQPYDANYILIKDQTATISTWRVLDDTIDNNDVWLTGNYPKFGAYEILTGDNTYVCYGHYIENYNSDAGTCPQFKSNGWDILYPVKRNSIFPYPKSYLCNFDYFDLLI